MFDDDESYCTTNLKDADKIPPLIWNILIHLGPAIKYMALLTDVLMWKTPSASILIVFLLFPVSVYFTVQLFKMCIQFFYEDGRGHVVDEELFAIETISSRTQFLKDKPPERPNPAIHPTANEMSNEDVDMELCNKRRYTFYSDD